MPARLGGLTILSKALTTLSIYSLRLPVRTDHIGNRSILVGRSRTPASLCEMKTRTLSGPAARL